MTTSVLIQSICLENFFFVDTCLNKLLTTPVGCDLLLQMDRVLQEWGFTGGSDLPGVLGQDNCRCSLFSVSIWQTVTNLFQIAAQDSGLESQYTDTLSKQGSCPAHSLPAFLLNMNMNVVCPTALSSSICTGYNVVPYKAPVFLTWASDLNSWGLQNQLAAADVPKGNKGSTRDIFSISKGPKESTHLPTMWWHRLKCVYLGLELCQLSGQWPWLTARGGEALAGS